LKELEDHIWKKRNIHSLLDVDEALLFRFSEGPTKDNTLIITLLPKLEKFKEEWPIEFQHTRFVLSTIILPQFMPL